MTTTKVNIELIKPGTPNSLLGRVNVPQTEDVAETLAADVNKKFILETTGATLITVNPGVSFDDNDEVVILDGTITKDISLAWAAGDGNGGLDAGTIASDTWYHVHLIRDDSEGTHDVLFSLNKTTPTVPAGYTKIKRLGCVITDAASEIIPFFQVDNFFQWKTHSEEYFFSGSGNNALDATFNVRVPNDIKCRVFWTIGLRSIDSRSNVFSVRPASLPEHAASVGGQFLARGLELSGVPSSLPSNDWDTWSNSAGFAVMENEDQMTWKFSNSNNTSGSNSINSAVFYTWGYEDLEI